MTREIGMWLLPQPAKISEYVKIPILRPNAPVPFGYKLDENEPGWYIPVPIELDALKMAKKYVNKYTYKEVAAWLSKQTGRNIDQFSLRKRIKHERRFKNRRNLYLTLAKRYKAALEKARQYEERLSKEERVPFYEEVYFLDIFGSGDSTDDSGSGHCVQAESGATDELSSGG